MKYKVIVSDVDGTLFESGNQVNDSTLKWVDAFQQAGGIFTLATGRMKKAVDLFIEQLNIQVPVIVYNGAQLIDPINNKLIKSYTIENELAYQVLRTVKEFQLDPILHVHQQPYVLGITAAIEAHTLKDGIACQVTDDAERLLQAAPTKFLIIGEPEEIQRFLEVLKQKYPHPFHHVFSDWNYLEILPMEASKGNALKHLSDYLGIGMGEIAAVGDERNDLSMLRNAGFGAAVANANDDLKKLADYVAEGSFHRGLEEVIRKILEDVK